MKRLKFKSIDYYMQKKHDNFLIIRILAAIAVIYGHSFALTVAVGQRDFVLMYLKKTHIAHEAVSIFFVISGFLVTGSYLNRKKFTTFMKSRILRVYPALIICLLLTVVILGPIVSTYSVNDYFSQGHTYSYFLKNLSLIKPDFSLPGVFTDNRLTGVNGSLWTLPAEIRMYIFLGLFGFLGILYNKVLFNVVLLVFITMSIWQPDWVPLMSHNHKYFRLGGMFALGVFMYIYRHDIPLNAGILLILFIASWISYSSPYFLIVFSFLLAYSVIYFAYVPIVKNNEKYLMDISYGLYIYAFPIQQLLVYYYPEIRPYALFWSATFITTLFAIVSWKYIEKPMLKLKKPKA